MGKINISDKVITHWSANIHCCSESLWIVLGRLTSEEAGRDQALITLVVNTLESINIEMQEVESSQFKTA